MSDAAAEKRRADGIEAKLAMAKEVIKMLRVQVEGLKAELARKTEECEEAWGAYHDAQDMADMTGGE